MGRDSDWTSKYLGSDHHTDRYVATVVRYEDKTGLSHQEPPYRVVADWMKNRGTMMAYNSVDYDSMAPVRSRRAVSMAYGDLDDVDDTYVTPGFFPASRKALNISNKAMDDGDVRTSISSRKDQQLLSDITAKLADIAQPVSVKMHARRRQVAPRAFAGRGANIYTYVGLPDDVAYSRRMTRASSVPPRPILSAAEFDYAPRPARRLEYPTEDVTVPAYAPTYHSARRSMYPPPDITVSRRVRYAYRENSPELDAVPAYTLNRLRVRTTDARNKMDAHRTLLDRYMPETFGAEQDVASAVLYKYGELVDRARRLGHRCQTLGKDYERSYAARKEIPSIMRTNAYSDYYYY